jgi:hypothetical protein
MSASNAARIMRRSSRQERPAHDERTLPRWAQDLIDGLRRDNAAMRLATEALAKAAGPLARAVAEDAPPIELFDARRGAYRPGEPGFVAPVQRRAR